MGDDSPVVGEALWHMQIHRHARRMVEVVRVMMMMVMVVVVGR